jgi:hypothetical protein
MDQSRMDGFKLPEGDQTNDFSLVPINQQVAIPPAPQNLGSQILIRQGRVDENQPEYVQFKRENITRWGSLTHLIQQVEKLIFQYSIPFCYLDSNRMLDLAELEMDKYSRDDLLSLVINLQQVVEAMTDPKVMFKGPNGPVIATIKIQTAWRRYKAYSSFAQLRHLMKMATIVQRKYRLY